MIGDKQVYEQGGGNAEGHGDEEVTSWQLAVARQDLAFCI